MDPVRLHLERAACAANGYNLPGGGVKIGNRRPLPAV